MADEPKRPYYIKPEKKLIVLQVVTAIVKPLHVGGDETTYRLIVQKPQKSSASKQVIDN